jgi:DNA primase
VSLELMKVNVMASRAERFHLDTFDFYVAKARAAFASQAALELGVDEEIIKHDLGRVLLKLEELQTQHFNNTLAPKAPVTPKMSVEEETAALALLCDPGLIERIVSDFDTCGLIGERANKLIGYLAAVSRQLDRPLGIVIQSSSAAGKTSLLDAVLAFIPEEERVKYSAMTGQSLFYMGETNLKHKVLAIVEEAGASRASYALKLLQSEGELTIASTGKDPQSGNLVTQEYRVEGPVALLLTTTARDLDEELLNRCWCSRSMRAANRPKPCTACSASGARWRVLRPSTSGPTCAGCIRTHSASSSRSRCSIRMRSG